MHLEASEAVGARLGVKAVDPLAARPLIGVVAAYLRVVRPLLEQGSLIVGRIAPLLARDQQQRAANLDLVRRLRAGEPAASLKVPRKPKSAEELFCLDKAEQLACRARTSRPSTLIFRARTLSSS